jgi:flavin reductase (DIM6/NTAB) family NADH-FMN oxidoreductase RutF
MKTQLKPYVHQFPAPAVLIGCGTIEKPNLITCSWFGTVCSDPPTVSVSIRRKRYSFSLVQEIKEFTANFLRASDLDKIIYCGTKSGRDTDKFRDLRLTSVSCPPLNKAPMIEECPLTLACSVKHELSLGSHTIFIAEVVGVHCDEELVRDDGRADPFPEEQIVYLDKKYWTLKKIG